MIGLDHALAQVREFHSDFGHPVSAKPTFLTRTRADTRADWMNEEVTEFTDAPATAAELSSDPERIIDTIVEQADAMIDLIYFALGTLVEMGVQPQPLMDIVHNQGNMSKKHMIDGVATVVKRADGKIIKPAGWVAPEPALRAEIIRQMKAA